MKPRHRTGLAALMVAVLSGATGCGATVGPPAAPVPAPRPLPDGVHDPADPPPPATTTTNPSGCTDPRASYRPGPAHGLKLDAIRARQSLRVGMGQTAYLMSYRDPVQGQMTGFEVDIVREIAKAILGDPNKITYVALDPRDWKAALEVNQDGTLINKDGADVDLVLGAMTMTCERWATWAFSTEYLPAGQRLLVKRDSGIKEIEDMGGRKACASTGSTNLRYIRETKPTNGTPIGVVSANSETDCMLLLQAGVVDGISTDDVILAGQAAQDKNVIVTGRFIVDEPCGIGMRRSDVDLIRFVNGVLAEIRGDGVADNSRTLWRNFYRDRLQRDLGDGTVPTPRYQD
jgi:polar amino acid transport system substrate-binding protein